MAMFTCTGSDPQQFAQMQTINRHDLNQHMCINQQCSMLDPCYTSDHLAVAPPMFARRVWNMCRKHVARLMRTLETHYIQQKCAETEYMLQKFSPKKT
eukprot:6085551-Amphidinium_carterae.1